MVMGELFTVVEIRSKVLEDGSLRSMTLPDLMLFS